MQSLKGETTPIGTLLSQESFFRVPEYQRPFSWDTDNFDDLVDDLVSAPKDQEYFLGTVVLHHREEDGHYDVVDGQQRLTSTLILFACLRDRVEDREFKEGLQKKILQERNVVDGIPARVRMEVRDRELFNKIVITDGGTDDVRDQGGLPEPEWRYVNAVGVFRSKLSDLSQEDLQELIAFLNQRCVVITLITKTFDDAFRLFTIVNDRGKQLRRVDVLKAMNIAPDAIASAAVRSTVAQQWEETERSLGESTYESIFHLVRLILLKDKPQGDLLKEFADRVFARKTVIAGEPFLDLIFEYSRLYLAVFMDRDFIPENDAAHNRYRSLIHIMDAEFKASEWRACLLAFARKHGQVQFYEFCLAMEKVYLEQWVKGVRKDERFARYAKILALIETLTNAQDTVSRIEYDLDVIKEATAREDMYSAGFCKYFLLRLELTAAEHDSVREFAARSIEHVLPQTPEKTGYWADNHDLNAIDEYVDAIGNLVLLSKSRNSSARNFDFDKKKRKYLQNRVSDYPRSIQVLGYNDWLRDTIESRTAEARDAIVSDP